MSLTAEQIEHLKTLDDIPVSTRVFRELCDLALRSLQHEAEPSEGYVSEASIKAVLFMLDGKIKTAEELPQYIAGLQYAKERIEYALNRRGSIEDIPIGARPKREAERGEGRADSGEWPDVFAVPMATGDDDSMTWAARRQAEKDDARMVRMVGALERIRYPEGAPDAATPAAAGGEDVELAEERNEQYLAYALPGIATHLRKAYPLLQVDADYIDQAAALERAEQNERDAKCWNYAVAMDMIRDKEDGIALIRENIAALGEQK
jgi:hypothetical protein